MKWYWICLIVFCVLLVGAVATLAALGFKKTTTSVNTVERQLMEAPESILEKNDVFTAESFVRKLNDWLEEEQQTKESHKSTEKANVEFEPLFSHQFALSTHMRQNFGLDLHQLSRFGFSIDTCGEEVAIGCPGYKGGVVFLFSDKFDKAQVLRGEDEFGKVVKYAHNGDLYVQNRDYLFHYDSKKTLKGDWSCHGRLLYAHTLCIVSNISETKVLDLKGAVVFAFPHTALGVVFHNHMYHLATTKGLLVMNQKGAVIQTHFAEKSFNSVAFANDRWYLGKAHVDTVWVLDLNFQIVDVWKVPGGTINPCLYGNQVVADSQHVFVSAPKDEWSGPNNGSLFVYDREKPVGMFRGMRGANYYASQVCLWKEYVLCAAPGNLERGEVFVYKKNVFT